MQPPVTEQLRAVTAWSAFQRVPPAPLVVNQFADQVFSDRLPSPALSLELFSLSLCEVTLSIFFFSAS